MCVYIQFGTGVLNECVCVRIGRSLDFLFEQCFREDVYILVGVRGA